MLSLQQNQLLSHSLNKVPLDSLLWQQTLAVTHPLSRKRAVFQTLLSLQYIISSQSHSNSRFQSLAFFRAAVLWLPNQISNNRTTNHIEAQCQSKTQMPKWKSPQTSLGSSNRAAATQINDLKLKVGLIKLG